jgi:hypothetical protein
MAKLNLTIAKQEENQQKDRELIINLNERQEKLRLKSCC